MSQLNSLIKTMLPSTTLTTQTEPSTVSKLASQMIRGTTNKLFIRPKTLQETVDRIRFNLRDLRHFYGLCWFLTLFFTMPWEFLLCSFLFGLTLLQIQQSHTGISTIGELPFQAVIAGLVCSVFYIMLLVFFGLGNRVLALTCVGTSAMFLHAAQVSYGEDTI